jgi:hypothetical protein
VADYTRVYTTDVSSSEILDMAEAYLVGLRGFSVPLGHEPTPNSAEFRLRGGLLGALVGGYPTARLTAEELGAKTRLTITTKPRAAAGGPRRVGFEGTGGDDRRLT